MSNLGTSGRSSNPLNILVMAGALVLAAIAGALIGFAIDSHKAATAKDAPAATAKGGNAGKADKGK